MKKLILLLLGTFILLQADDIIVFKNEYKVLTLPGKLTKVIIGNKNVINVSILDNSKKEKTLLKIYGKQSGNTSILLTFRNGTLKNYHVFVNQNLGFVQKMINTIAPHIQLSRVGDGSIVLSGKFDDPHQKKRVYELLKNAGVDLDHLMDITKTAKVNKMIRTKLYLVEINNNKAKELGGAIGLGLVGQKANIALNPDASTGVTFSGWLLNNAKTFSPEKGFSLLGTLKLLQSKGVANILDDTVLITTEDKNASFHVGGDVYIPIGITQTNGGYPTIQLEEKEYGLRLTLTTDFMEKKDYMHIKVEIRDSEFDPNKDHNVKLGGDNGAFSQGIEVPSFLSKHITTDIVAKSKQVIALGGRLHKDEAEVEQKVPILGDIPILGKLFTSTEKHYKANDLLFFLVPEIVDANNDIDDSKFYEKFTKESQTFHNNFVLEKKKETPKVIHSTEMKKSAIEPIDIQFEKHDTEERSLNTKSKKRKTKVQSKTDVKENDESIILLDEKDDRTKPSSTQPQQDSSLSVNAPADKQQHRFSKKNEKEESTLSEISSEMLPEKETSVLEPALDDEEDIESTEDTNKSLYSQNSAEDKKMLQNETNAKKMYIIDTTKIFIRKKPLNGKRVDVWSKGHRFVADGEQEAGGIVWLKITQDCSEGECKKLTAPLWVSKRYSKVITENIKK